MRLRHLAAILLLTWGMAHAGSQGFSSGTVQGIFLSEGAVEIWHQADVTWQLLSSQRPVAQMPALYQQGLRTWKEQGADQALALLSERALRTQPPDQAQEVDTASQAWMLRAKLQLVKARPGEAVDTMQMAVKALPSSANAWQFLGQMMLVRMAERQAGDADTALRQALQLRQQAGGARTSASLIGEARLHDTLGQLQASIGQAKAAARSWEQARGMYVDLRTQDPERFTDLASRANLNIALMQKQLGQYEAALQTLDETLVWRRQLAEWAPGMERQYEIATALLNRQENQEKLGRRCDAEATMNEAQGLLEELAELDPARFQQRLTRIVQARQLPLAGHKDCRGRTIVLKMEGRAEPALPSRQTLEETPPDQWPSRAQSWGQMSSEIMLIPASGSPALAVQWSLRRLGVQLLQEEAEPGQHHLPIAKTLMRVGSLHEMNGQKSLALESYRQSLTYWDPARQPGTPHPWTQNIIATLKDRMQKLSGQP